MEKLGSAINVLITAVVGTIIPAAITAVTSFWNRDAAKAHLEAERLRKDKDDERHS